MRFDQGLRKGKLWGLFSFVLWGKFRVTWALLKGKLWALLAGVCGLIGGFEGFIGALYRGKS